MEPPDVIYNGNFIQDDDRIADYICLMNWAFKNSEDYIYNRALTEMLKLLKFNK